MKNTTSILNNFDEQQEKPKNTKENSRNPQQFDEQTEKAQKKPKNSFYIF